ncbi:hypothetical protein [Clostridioides difficile]|uniref:hypothetical protein n=1 Tax=Clostridioides difficile TaxID=1496 RepID=UPI00093CB303|nr:hypothetical protein [Clostridioides difficile]EGT5043657.1 hypothetical protein [Clostridioides difficile]HBF2788302.1 hypothetical protein [Clostridioides difficile]HBF4061113.1 hypothetical protein [Clostridioides difficile]
MKGGVRKRSNKWYYYFDLGIVFEKGNISLSFGTKNISYLNNTQKNYQINIRKLKLSVYKVKSLYTAMILISKNIFHM